METKHLTRKVVVPYIGLSNLKNWPLTTALSAVGNCILEASEQSLILSNESKGSQMMLGSVTKVL